MRCRPEAYTTERDGRVNDVMATTPPLLIALPDGLNVSGVTMWAVRLVNAIAHLGGRAGVILHPEPEGQRNLGIKFDQGVRVFRCAARFGERPGDLSPFIACYRDAVRAMGDRVVLSPNLHGDCYGVAAALCLTEPECVRVLGWQHSDNEYDGRVLARYEPMLARCVAVSDAIEKALRTKLGDRVVNIPYGVRVPTEWKREARGDGGPVKLLYSGRLEHMQKRVMALMRLTDELDRRGVKHALTIVGDGPAAEEVEAKVRERVSVRRLAAVGPRGVKALLEEHDALVLSSRYEGLSVSVLEAMARGCVPIIARTRSGAEQAVTAESGEIADVGPEADEDETGFAMASAVQRFVSRDRAAMSRAAWERAGELFSIERHVKRVVRVLRDVMKEEGRVWPADKACAFTTSSQEPRGEGSGSVPPEGAAKMRAILESLRGKPVAIHGTGEHTRQLREVIAGAPVKLVAFADDDRQKHGTKLWEWPVVSPRDVSGLGATDVVISSWMHQDAVWERRGVYEGQGLKVWRVYS